MKILIATRNKDKFKLVSRLLKTSILNNEDELFNFNDLKEDIIDKKEVGDVVNRAYEKAFNLFNNLKKNDFDIIIGIDDVMEFNGKIIENVKKYIQDIIDDKFLNNGNSINVIRAFTFVNKKGEYKNIITTIPFTYKKLDYELTPEENTYPLSHVMVPLNAKIAIKHINKDKANDYTLNYSKDAFFSIKDFLSNC